MQIFPAALERLASSEFKTEYIIRVLKTLEQVLQANPGPMAEVVLHYQSEDDVVTSEDLIPVITFSLRQAT